VETHSKYADLSNVARDIFSLILHGVGVEASFSLGRDGICWRQAKNTGRTHSEKVILRKFAQAKDRILEGNNRVSDSMNTENDSEMQKEVEVRKLHRMAKVHDCLEMSQGSQNLRSTQKESHAQNAQIAAVGYISNTNEIVVASWPLLQNDCSAAVKLSERSSLPPALSAKHLSREGIQILIVSRIRIINHLLQGYFKCQ